MKRDYQETVNYLFDGLPMFSKIGQAAYKADLKNIKALCAAIGNPQEKFKSIHVAGTNGKGSVCHMLSAIFQESGYKTGLFTSPHLLDFRERIRINGRKVSKEFVMEFVEKCEVLIEKVRPSFFEMTTAMAFAWFAQNKIDIAVIEVGLGGRLDSTNVLFPELSVITNISLEHTQYLGNTRPLIAGEKAGIIKKKIPVVVGELDEETKPVYQKKAREQEASLYFAEEMYQAKKVKDQIDGQIVELTETASGEKSLIRLDLLGQYQIQNVRTLFSALKILKEKGWPLSAEKIKAGLAAVKQITGLRGRWEVLGEKPKVIADTSHNYGGLKEVTRQLKGQKYNTLRIVLGFSGDKDVVSILPLFPKEAVYYYCHADNKRALPVKELKETAGRFGLAGKTYLSVAAALQGALKEGEEEDLIMVTGSTFVVAEVFQCFQEKAKEQ